MFSRSTCDGRSHAVLLHQLLSIERVLVQPPSERSTAELVRIAAVLKFFDCYDAASYKAIARIWSIAFEDLELADDSERRGRALTKILNFFMHYCFPALNDTAEDMDPRSCTVSVAVREEDMCSSIDQRLENLSLEAPPIPDLGDVTENLSKIGIAYAFEESEASPSLYHVDNVGLERIGSAYMSSPGEPTSAAALAELWNERLKSIMAASPDVDWDAQLDAQTEALRMGLSISDESPEYDFLVYGNLDLFDFDLGLGVPAGSQAPAPPLPAAWPIIALRAPAETAQRSRFTIARRAIDEDDAQRYAPKRRMDDGPALSGSHLRQVYSVVYPGSRNPGSAAAVV